MVDGIDSIVQSLNIYRISLWLMDVDAIDMIMQLDTLRVQNNLGKTSSDFRQRKLCPIRDNPRI